MLTPVSCSFPVQGCSLRNLILYECLQPFLRFHALSMSKGAALETCFYRQPLLRFHAFFPFQYVHLKRLVFSEHLQPFLRFHALFPFNNCILKGLSLVNACSHSSGLMPFCNRTNGIDTAKSQAKITRVSGSSCLRDFSSHSCMFRDL